MFSFVVCRGNLTDYLIFMQEKKYNFVYQTKNMVNGKTYIGVRCTNRLNDGYIGCGITNKNTAIKQIKLDKSKGYKHNFKSAVFKYGYENFKREILCFFDTAAEAYEEEKFLVDEKWVKDSNNYNISLGGKGGHMGYGKLNHKYRGDIHIFNRHTKEYIGTYESAQQIKEILGFNQSAVSSILRLEKSYYKEFFFSRDYNNWLSLYNKAVFNTSKRIENKKNGNERKIIALNKDLTVYKVFNSKASACRVLGKSKNGVCYLDDVVDKYNKRTGKRLIAWGYHWTYGRKI